MKINYENINRQFRKGKNCNSCLGRKIKKGQKREGINKGEIRCSAGNFKTNINKFLNL